MANAEPTLADLAKRGELSALEDRWLSAMEDADRCRDDLLEALAILNGSGMGEEAAALAWTWLASEKDRRQRADLLALGREVIVRCADNDELRQEVLQLYGEVFADRPGLTRLVEASGLAGGRSVRRALRTLEICLGLEVGDFLITRSDEQAAEVVAIDAEACIYTLRSKQGERTFDPDELALVYDPVEVNDFRVLTQLRPERIGQALENDPAALVIGVLQSHRGRLDSDQLEPLLSPRYIPADNWRKWWTKAKAALKRCPHVVLEGRNPVILTYHAEGRSLEDEIEPQWRQAKTPAERLAVVETYLREGKARRTGVNPAMIERLCRDLLARVEAARPGAPSEALTEALIIDRLGEAAELPDGSASTARQILDEDPDPVSLLRGVGDTRLYLRGIVLVRAIKPDDWPAVYARLLPSAPLDACEPIARALGEAGHRDRLAEAVGQIPSDFTNHLDALCWLWRGPSIEGLQPMSPRELLPKLLDHLAELNRSDTAPAEVRRNARTKIRTALGAEKYARYKEVIAGMDPGLASTIHRTVERLEGLGQVVRSDLLRIVVDTHPQLLAAKPKVDPWSDDGVIFCTHEGMQRQEKELSHLLNVKIPQNAKAIGEAASRGDLSENSEYRFALEERDLLHARVARMQNELSLARLLTVNDVSDDEVNIGTRVTLQDVDRSKRREITILGPWEADVDQGVYNYRAPLCGKLKGLRVGDTLTLDIDDGEREYRVEAVVNALTGRNFC